MYISGIVLFCLFMYFWSRDKERTKQLDEIKQSIQDNQSRKSAREEWEEENDPSYYDYTDYPKSEPVIKPAPKTYSNPLEQWYQDALAANGDEA